MTMPRVSPVDNTLGLHLENPVLYRSKADARRFLFGRAARHIDCKVPQPDIILDQKAFALIDLNIRLALIVSERAYILHAADRDGGVAFDDGQVVARLIAVAAHILGDFNPHGIWGTRR